MLDVQSMDVRESDVFIENPVDWTSISGLHNVLIYIIYLFKNPFQD